MRRNTAWRIAPGGVLLRMAAVLTFVAALAAGAAAGEEARTILRVYAWSEFFAPEVLAQFEDEHECVVAIDTFDSNEAMLEEMEKDGRENYDLITPSSYMSTIMNRQGLLTPIDHGLIPNLANIDPAFVRLSDDPDMRHSVPYTRTVTGIGYNRAALGNVRHSWSVFARGSLAGQMTMLDDMRESLGAALKHLGFSLNTTDAQQLSRAGDLLRDWRRNLAKFAVDEGIIGLGSGHYLAVHGYNGDVAVLMEGNPDIDFFVPAEGSALTVDEFVIPSGAQNRELAHAFINHLFDHDVAAKNMASILYFMPVPGAVPLLSQELRDNHALFVPEATLANCEAIRDVGDANALYEEIWEAVTGEAGGK